LCTTSVVPQEEAFLKRYIEYCRQSCTPRIAESAAKLLANEYVELRAEVGASRWECVEVAHREGRLRQSSEGHGVTAA
jgi:DNA replicative helicase MCM subunit Mcm2 (Cdc46/Mcm family)